MEPNSWIGRYRPMNTTTLSVRTSLIAAVHAEPWMPEATTYIDSTNAPIHTAAVEETDPDDVCDTMIPRPFSCSARYGIIAATATTETSTPSPRESYLETKKSACESSLRGVA